MRKPVAHPLPPSSPFVSFEGIDGSGKSTVMAAVAAALNGPVWTTREETDRFGAAIRASIKSGRDPLVTTYLFLADRFAHAQEIRRHLDAAEVVLCDRFLHSTLAYQGVTLQGRIEDPVAWLRSLHAPLGLEPDLVLWLDVPPETAVERAAGRGATAPYEKAGFLAKVRVQYERLASEEARIMRIDGDRPPDEVARDAIAAVRTLLD